MYAQTILKLIWTYFILNGWYSAMYLSINMDFKLQMWSVGGNIYANFCHRVTTMYMQY